ncbi:MAG: ABC-F family ATP-binding cassette domain-containing protein [candidate division Zixibacteria bacterium]|nr:ABC-F family ATP-binding cassette domain-containing protein [candidate division Zixibacteria bacterium]
MTLLAAEQIAKRFKDQIILETVSFTIFAGERIALVGKNGIGKTTLLEMLAGIQEPDTGTITRSRTCLIDYVEQEKTDYLDMSLFEFVTDARADLIAMRRRISELEHALELNPHSREQLEELGHLQQVFEKDGGLVFEHEVGIILDGLGFTENRYSDRLRNFSGGEKNRAGLARLLAGRGNLLLLDEPTNHLDIDSTRWLEAYLRQSTKAYLIVSHDRAFLTAAADKVWEMSYGKLDVYTGGFERYLNERIDRRRLAEHHYRHQLEEIKRVEEFIRRNMAGQKTKQAQSRLKYLNRIKRLPPPRAEGTGPAIRVKSSGRSYAHVLSVEEVALGYGDAPVLESVSFEMYRGERVGLIGRNGSGKSTLLKALIGELEPIAGNIRLGNNIDVAYFDQELSDLDETATVLDNIWLVDPGAEVGPMRSYLGRFGFAGEDALKVVSALSGGEKTKLCLARLLYHPANFVILDEPTNHLDIYAREALESALLEYEGSCLIVSHDRFFLDRVVNKVVHIKDGQARVYDGNYSYFVEKTAPVAAGSTANRTKEPKSARSEVSDFKMQSRRKAKLKKDLQSARSRIADLEKELESLETGINGGIPAFDWERLHAASQRKREVEGELLTLYDTVEELEKELSD